MVLTRRAVVGGMLGLPWLGCRGRSDPRLVVVAARGGWDTLYAVDPKGPTGALAGPDDADEDIQNLGGIPIAVNPTRRPAIGALFQRWGSSCVVVNGIQVGSIAHVECVRRVWTGGDDPAAPDVTALAGSTRGCLDLGPGAVGGALAASMVRAGSSSQVDGLDPAVGFTAQDRSAILAWRDRRTRQIGAPPADVEAWQAADALGARLPIDFDPDDPAGTAVAALESGWGAVYLDPRHTWDTHQDNNTQHASWDSLAGLLHGLLTDLDTTGLLDRTLVLVLSEMGRAPFLNADAGKDHWPVTSSLMFGGLVRGGRVLGATSDGLVAMPVDLASGAPDPRGDVLRPANVLAGVLAALDLDAEAAFPGAVPLEL